ncbi:Lipase_GDSL domain-containing protein [Cephalotus follicularis]|uniref:Lipase_GDSL domain-containing protein n=1 Tax=Cephalotus follicularis TaxID=3775 RepID=A0A1Q3C9L3_CEPFO|nr:Lipase_GDSL domain-containing protein [Cephalotus follicularis]
MESTHRPSLPVSLLTLFLYLLLFIAKAQDLRKQKPWNHTVSAIYVFGDSTVDPGNNNYVTTAFRSNFLPYGMDFSNQIPTGRFSNGRLTTDFMASYMGIKESVPPYLDPTLSIEEIMNGVSFASAGSGFDPLTPRISGVIEISKQVEYFKEYKKRMELVIGKQRMENHIEKAIYIISAGTNDFVVNYFTIPVRRKTYSITAYQQFVLQMLKQLIQALSNEGARRMAISGLPQMGCLPIVITLNSENAIQNRDCIELYSSVARVYNMMLQNELEYMQLRLASHGFRIYYVDIYAPLDYMIQGRGKFEFDEVSQGCCGTGYLEAAFLCNPKSYVCPDASKYVFFDSIHPTEKTYYNVFQAALPVINMLISD